ncbi:MAG TPA: zinc ribbon domain-containing protein [Longimicrobium sp.]|nr:zinc ribbon domain-containing protein [Longimicrobium sp.]
MAIREGRWDCPSCGSTRIYGRHVDCPGCGQPRPAGTRFYLAEGEPVVTDPERLAEARAGADWVCARCGASNRATLHACAGCGAAHEVESVQPVVEYTLADTPRPVDAASAASAASATPSSAPPESTGSAPLSSADPGSLPPASAGSPPPPSGGGEAPGESGTFSPAPTPLAILDSSKQTPLKRKVGLGLAGATGLVLLGSAMIDPERTPKPEPAIIDAVVWERVIVIEEHGIVAGEGWALPDSAIDVVRTERVREYRDELAGYETVEREVPRTRSVLKGYRDETRTVSERVQTGTRTYTCGTRDLGNGYFDDVECTEPEYETVTRTEVESVPVYEDETYYETVTERKPIYRQVPVMAPYYTYRAPQWTPVDTLRLAGTWMIPPAWPRVDSLPPNRREQWRNESNRVILRARDGDPRSLEVREEELVRLRPGQRVAYAPAGGGRYPDAVLPRDSLPQCRRWHSGRGRPPPDSLGCSPRPAR